MPNSPRQPPAPTSSPSVDRRTDHETSKALFRPIVLLQPDRMVHPPSWLEHIPFAFWLIDVLRPRVFVELGTHSGNSYAAFAQAVQHLGFEAAGYAVDTWRGDPQAGFYDESVFTDWQAYHDSRYTAFSALVRTTFDDAVGHFQDHGIDLLNIDGYHTTEAVSHDFNTWLPKMSARGVVLMHDINVRERDFGAWRAWQELRTAYPSFEFLHGYGLGVLAVGTEVPPELEWLLSPDAAAPGRAIAIRQFFSRAGGALLSQYRAAVAEREQQSQADLERMAIHAATVSQLELESTTLRERLADQSARLAQAEAHASARLAQADAVATDLTAQLDDAAARLQDLELQLVESGEEIDRVNAGLKDAAAVSDALEQSEARVADLQQEVSRWAAARSAMQTLAVLPSFPLAAANRALVATTNRLRALARTGAAVRPRPSRPVQAWATLRALGVTPRHLLRRPRQLATLVRLVTRPRLFKDAHLIVQSGLFDASHYQRLAPDTAAAGANPLVHFVTIGGAEGRSPCLLFDAAWYLARYPDVASARVNPLAHYLRAAPREDRDPHPLFAASFYRQQLGAQGLGVDPLRHYLTDGVIEGRSPHPLFDPAYYVETSGAALTDVDPFAHFLAQGAAAGINPHPLFDIAYYRANLPAQERAAGNPLQHYLHFGSLRGRRPHPLFDPAYYRAMNADVVMSGVEPLMHYVTAGGPEGRPPLPDFDAAWYLASYQDVAESGASPLIHYLRHGWLEGRNPSPRFDTMAYLGRYEDVTRSGVNPLTHYLEYGAAEGRSCASDDALELLKDTATAPVRLHASTPERPPLGDRVIVCLTHVMPVAPRAGNEYRIHRMLKWLRRSGYVVIPIVAPTDGTRPGTAEVRAIAEEFGNAIVCQPDGRVEYLLQDVPDVLRSLDGEMAEPFAAQLREGQSKTEHEREMLRLDRAFCSDALIATVLRLQSVLGRYVLLAEYIWMSRVLPLVGARALKVIDTIDVFSTRHDKVGQFGIDDLVVEPDAERLRLGRADVAIAIQHNERQTLNALVPGVRVVTGGVDFEVISESATPTGRQVLYVASDNPMNRHGLRDFLRFAWPRVRDAVPDAELLVVGDVGRSVPLSPAGVTVLGRVDDLEPLYHRCRVVINPAVAGTGVKIKTLEALSHLRRVVTWPNGVDGLSPAVAALCRTVQDWYSFSEQLVAVLTNDTAAVFSADDRELLAREAAPDLVYAELGQVIAAFFDDDSHAGDTVRAPVLP